MYVILANNKCEINAHTEPDGTINFATRWKFEINVRSVIFNLILVIYGWVAL